MWRNNVLPTNKYNRDSLSLSLSLPLLNFPCSLETERCNNKKQKCLWIIIVGGVIFFRYVSKHIIFIKNKIVTRAWAQTEMLPDHDVNTVIDWSYTRRQSRGRPSIINSPLLQCREIRSITKGTRRDYWKRFVRRCNGKEQDSILYIYIY